MANWYVSSVAYSNITQWAASTSYSVGQIIRQLATPPVGSERAFRCTTAGISGTTEPTWATGNNGVTTSGNAQFTEVTGQAVYAWNAAGARLPAILNKIANGDTIFVSSDHVENYASSISYTIPSVFNNGSSILCVNRAGSVPPVAADIATGALFMTTGDYSITLQPVGLAYVYGITLRQGVNSTSNQYMALGGNAAQLNARKCRFEIACTGTNSQINPRVKNEWSDCTVKFAHANQKIVGDGPEITWSNSETVHAVDATGSIPTYLFGSGNQIVHLIGLDLSDLGANIFDHTGNPNGMYINARNCKFSTSFNQPNPFLINGGELTYVNCDSGSTNYKSGKITYAGTESTELSIVRSGGATDGVTPTSRKIVTNNGATKLFPFKSIPIAIWNEVVGSPVTATIYGIWNGAAVPNNDDVWLSIEYEGNNTSPQSSLISSGFSPLAASTPLPGDTSVWGSGSTTKFKISVTFTPQKKGPIYFYVRAAKSAQTIYIDPQPVLS